MDGNMITSIEAVNKWFFYSMNYRVVPVEVEDFEGPRAMYLPDCFNAFPKHLRGHLAGKWEALYESYGSRAVLSAFYAELSSNYRIALVKWVMENYNDEQKLHFEED